MDKEMSAALMADFTGEQIGHKPATWCKGCSAAVRNKTGKVCGDHKVVKCQKCKTNITEAHICLSFVGHADVRARLCEVDPEWTWAPFDFPGSGSLIISDGYPVGLWIILTVGGVSKPGYGSVDKGNSEAMKELIGDALRNAGLSFGIAWKLWAKGERSSGEGEGGQSGATGDTWDNAPAGTARGGNGSVQRGQVSRPAPSEPSAQPAAEADPDAQQYADEGSQARTVAEVEAIHKRARQAGKIGAVIKAPESGNPGKLAVYLDWRRKQLADVDKAWKELNDAQAAARIDIGEVEVLIKQLTGADIESASAAQLRQAAAKLRERAA